MKFASSPTLQHSLKNTFVSDSLNTVCLDSGLNNAHKGLLA